MTLRNKIFDNHAFSLVELMIVLVILSMMLVVGGVTLKPSIDKGKLRSCSAKIVSDIQLIRSRAQSEGRRAIFQITALAKATDIDGDGVREYYIGFIDTNSNSVHNTGEKVFIRGTSGDELCANLVSIDRSGTPATTITNDQIVFDPLGIAMNGATKQNLFLIGSGNAYRIELVSVTGALRNYMNSDNCNDDGCDANDNWVPVQ